MKYLKFNDAENKLTTVRRERDEFRRKLQQVQDENDLMKSYMNRLPTEIEYEQLKQRCKILEDQLRVSKESIEESRDEKILLKNQLKLFQGKLVEQKEKIENLSKLEENPLNYGAKYLTMDERAEVEKEMENLRKLIADLNGKLNEEKLRRREEKNVEEKNRAIVENLSKEIRSKEEEIQKLKILLRQVRKKKKSFS